MYKRKNSLLMLVVTAVMLCMLTGCGDKSSAVLKEMSIKSLQECASDAEMIEDSEINNYTSNEDIQYDYNKTAFQSFGFETAENADKAIDAYKEYLESQGFAEVSQNDDSLYEIYYYSESKDVGIKLHKVAEYNGDGKWNGHPVVYFTMEYNAD